MALLLLFLYICGKAIAQGMVPLSQFSKTREHVRSFIQLLRLQFHHWLSEPKVDVTLVLSFPLHWLRVPISLSCIDDGIYLTPGAKWGSGLQSGRKLTPQEK